MIDFILDNIWFILFVVWGLPLSYYRSNFRKMVYNTNSWVINIKPVFMKEIKVLVNPSKNLSTKLRKYRKFYGIYLLVYLLLFSTYMFASEDKKGEIVKIGSSIPSFVLKDQYGKNYDINNVLKKKNIVIFFYPKDNTAGCTKQVCSFRDAFNSLNEVEAEVIGISKQSVKSHLEFSNKHNLNYKILSDTDNKVRKLFGVPSSFLGLFPGRVTYIVNKKGVVIQIYNSQLNATQHVKEALKALKK